MGLTIYFDVDGTLIDFDDQPRGYIIDMLRTLVACGHKVGVWSGGGKDYAEVWCRRLFIHKIVSDIRMKPMRNEDMLDDVDLCFDDEEVNLAKVNVRV